MGAKVATFEQCYNAEKRRRLHFKSYKEDTPLEVYSLTKIPPTELKGVDNSLFQANYSEETSWKRLRINAILPTTWKILFEQIISIIKSRSAQW